MHYYIEAFRKFATFEGRARRKEYWLFVLFNFLFALAAAILDNLFGIAGDTTLLGPIYVIYGIASLIPSLSLAVRRLHDTGRPGPFIFICLIPLVGTIIFFAATCIEGDAGENRFGHDPKGSAGERPSEDASVAHHPDEAAARGAFRSDNAMETARIPAFYADGAWRRTHYVIMTAASVISFLFFLVFLRRLAVIDRNVALAVSDLFSPRKIGLIVLSSFLPIAFVSLGTGLVFARGGFDLSVGSAMALSSVVAANCIASGVPGGAAIALLCALGIGIVNATLVGVAKAPGVLATIATALVARSVAIMATGGRAVQIGNERALAAIGPLSWCVLALAAAGLFLWLQAPGFGAKRDDEARPTASGLRRAISLGIPYLVSSLLAAFAGLFLTMRLRTGGPSLGVNYEIEALAAVLLSGSVLGARRANVAGILVGSLVLASFMVIASIMSLDVFITSICVGAIAILWFIINRVVAGMMDASYLRRARG